LNAYAVCFPAERRTSTLPNLLDQFLLLILTTLKETIGIFTNGPRRSQCAMKLTVRMSDPAQIERLRRLLSSRTADLSVEIQQLGGIGAVKNVGKEVNDITLPNLLDQFLLLILTTLKDLSSFVRLIATTPDLQTYAVQKLYSSLKEDISQEVHVPALVGCEPIGRDTYLCCHDGLEFVVGYLQESSVSLRPPLICRPMRYKSSTRH
jgi:hypothetical protein